jgi:hypothetical protein
MPRCDFQGLTKGREGELAEWIQTMPLPAIIERLGAGKGDEEAVQRGLLKLYRGDAVLSRALETRIGTIVAQSNPSTDDDAISTVAKETGMSPRTIRGFARRKGIQLTPTLVMAELGEPNAIQIGSSVDSSGMSVRVLSGKTEASQAVLLEDILKAYSGTGIIPDNPALAAMYPDPSISPRTLNKNLKILKRQIYTRLIRLLAEVKAEQSSERRGIWEELDDTHAELDSPEVIERRRVLRKALEKMGEDSHADRVLGLQRKINDAFFSGRDVCPLTFSERLIRLDAYGDADQVLHPQVPTPQTLEEVSEQLMAYSVARYKPHPRMIADMSTDDLRRGAHQFDNLLAKKLRHLTPQRRGHLGISVLTGEQPRNKRRDWQSKDERRQAIEQLISAAGGDPTEVTSSLMGDTYGPNLAFYYMRQQGARSYQEATLLALKEFDMLSKLPKGPKDKESQAQAQERKIMTRRNTPLLRKLFLQHYDPGRTVRDYGDYLFLGQTGLYYLLNGLRYELTRAFDDDHSIRQIADSLGVGARGIANLRLDEAQRDENGLICMIRTRDKPLQADITEREDMLSLEDLGGRLRRRLNDIRAIDPGNTKAAGSVQRPELVEQIDQTATALLGACDRRDWEAIRSQSGELTQSLGKLNGSGEITISVSKGERPIQRRTINKALRDMALLAQYMKAEAAFE